MANPEHLAKLKEGVQAWNEWRRTTSGSFRNLIISPDLSGEDLTGWKLPHADLKRVNLKDARLADAWLEDADLSDAVLSSADLSEANLSGANLQSATLTNANLRGAKFTGANLTKADLSGADLHAVQLGGSFFETGADEQPTVTFYAETLFVDADLTGAKGLDRCDHIGPSYLDVYTVINSSGLPIGFMQGCGLPQKVIEFYLKLQPSEFYSCFISYSSKDQEFAERLHADLQNSGVRCWFAPENMKIGDRIRIRIDESIRIHDKLLLVLSENSIVSDWVEKEVETAFEKERQRKTTVLFPIRLDDAAMDSQTGWAADIRRSRHIGDFTRWKDHHAYKKAFDRLLRDLRAEAAAASAP